MSYTPNQGLIRHFILFTQNHVADPAWLVPVVETDSEGKIIAQYTSVEEVKSVVDKMQIDLEVNAVRMVTQAETLQKTLDILGVTREEYDKKRGEHYGKSRTLAE